MIDWNAISAIATAGGSIVTAIGVSFAAWQFWQSKKQHQAQFEDQLDQQYRALSMDIPVDVLIGKPMDEVDRDVREKIYNYCDLSNEQAFFRSKGRISASTWKSWALGIQAHMARPAFKQVYNEVKGVSGFTYLEKLVETKYESDPITWKNNRN